MYFLAEIFLQNEKGCYICNRITRVAHFIGEMAEWSIAAVLKTVVPRGTGGSNPSLSAEKKVLH